MERVNMKAKELTKRELVQRVCWLEAMLKLAEEAIRKLSLQSKCDHQPGCPHDYSYKM